MSVHQVHYAAAHEHADRLLNLVCRRAGPFNLLEDLRAGLKRDGILGALRRHNTRLIYGWLMKTLSFQGIADRVAQGYIDEHGNVSFDEVRAALQKKPSCPKLTGFWSFSDCGYEKWSASCREPALQGACPLPKHELRNGRLNQTAYSLYLFLRDVADGDFAGWLEDALAEGGLSDDPLSASRDAILQPFRGVFGVSDKVVSMALSCLLLGASGTRPQWLSVGSTFVVVDTLVHNFLHRTGILQRFGADHVYGSTCYTPGRCADLLRELSRSVDASAFNPAFPRHFPRFVQIAIWRFCAEGGLDVCNGNRIDDLHRCDNVHCQLQNGCDRQTLYAQKTLKKR
jgi:hypothetical protein